MPNMTPTVQDEINALSETLDATVNLVSKLAWMMSAMTPEKGVEADLLGLEGRMMALRKDMVAVVEALARLNTADWMPHAPPSSETTIERKLRMEKEKAEKQHVPQQRPYEHRSYERLQRTDDTLGPGTPVTSEPAAPKGDYTEENRESRQGLWRE